MTFKDYKMQKEIGIKMKSIKSIKLKKKVVVISIIALAIIGIGASSYAKAKKAKIKQVSISKVVKKDITQTVSATGNIEARLRNDITLGPTQKVVKVLVSEGQQVKKGDILLQLDASEYENQLAKQKLSLANAQSTLNQLTSTGIINDRNSAENAVAQAEISLNNAQRNYDDANKKLQQSKSLLDSGVIPQNEYDAAEKAAEDAANAVKTAEIQLTNGQNSLNNINATSGDKVTNQRNQIASVQADIDNLNKKIEDCNVRATTDGKVIRMDAKEGQLPKTGDMVIVDDNSQYRVTVDMNQYDAVKVVKGQKANIKVKGSSKKYTGTVTDIGQMAQTKINGTDQEYKVNVKVTLDNADEDIKAGYEADVEIILNEKPKVLTIGFDGIKDEKSSGKKFIYVVDNKQKASKKYVKIGLETDYDVELTDGLKEGDKYIINPPENLREGDIVADSAASKVGGKK